VEKHYEFHDGQIDYADIEADPTDKAVTKLLRVISITRTPGGRIAKVGLSITKPKPREIEVSIAESIARAIVKIFDDADAEEEKH